MHLETILGLIAEREAAAHRTADQLREQIITLNSELTQLDNELTDLATTAAPCKRSPRPSSPPTTRP